MAKFIGSKNGQITVVSDKPFTNSELQILELPSTLQNVPVEQLMLDYTIRSGIVSHKDAHRPIKELRIAIVSNYAQMCGLSTYMENLLEHLAPKLGDFKLFVETNDKPTNSIVCNRIITCWTRGQPLDQLVAELKAYQPDVVLLNHEFGLFPNARHWLSLITQLSAYKVLTIMHSIFPNHHDKTIVEASMRNILVHSPEAKQALLTTKGITSNIYVIPHGCYASENKGKLWNFYKSNNTFVQMGFGFRYKAFEDCIQATALLKPKYSDVFFTALFSESPHAQFEHQTYYNSLMELIEKLDIKANVGIVRGFQSDKVVDSYLRTNQVAVFPYKMSSEHLVFGASGAARLAMSKNIPVISSSIPHFADLNTIKATNPAEIARELDALFSDRKKMTQQVAKQNEFIEANSWAKTAERYVEVLENLPSR